MTHKQMSNASGDLPFDGDPTEEEIEEFESFLEQGGRALLDQEEAVREAKRKRMIRQGEISFLDLARVLYRRAERLVSLAQMKAPTVILDAEVDLIKSGAEDLRLSHEHTLTTEETDCEDT